MTCKNIPDSNLNVIMVTVSVATLLTSNVDWIMRIYHEFEVAIENMVNGLKFCILTSHI